MATFDARIIYKDKESETFTCEKFSDIPYDRLMEENVKLLTLDFSEAITEPTPYQLSFDVCDNTLNYLEASIEIAPGAIEVLLRDLEEKIYNFLLGWSNEKKAQTARERLKERNDILFEMFVESDESWAGPLVAIAAAGIVGVLSKKKVDESELALNSV